MAIDWHHLQARYNDLAHQLTSASLDPQKRVLLQKEVAHAANLISKHKDITDLETNLAKIRRDMQEVQDTELHALFQEELQAVENALMMAQQDLEDMLYPSDERDTRSVFLEMRAGTGGAEAALFAADLLKMYTNYALKKGWRASIVDMSETDLGGIREVTLHIEGKDVYKHLKREAGVHRVQRVPKTETQGRVHTSTATVAVLPEVEEVEISINPQDLRIDTYRSGGAGGQHVNKTDSAIRITHIPSGIVVACQEERSQHKNRAKAMKMLQSRLLVAQQEKQEKELGQERKKMIGTGERAEKVRTYNFPQNRITDHQIDLTLKNLDVVIQGELDGIIEPLMAYDRQERRRLQESSI